MLTGQETFCMRDNGFCNNNLQWKDWNINFKSGGKLFLFSIVLVLIHGNSMVGFMISQICLGLDSFPLSSLSLLRWLLLRHTLVVRRWILQITLRSYLLLYQQWLLKELLRIHLEAYLSRRSGYTYNLRHMHFFIHESEHVFLPFNMLWFSCVATDFCSLSQGGQAPEVTGSPTEKAILSWGLQVWLLVVASAYILCISCLVTMIFIFNSLVWNSVKQDRNPPFFKSSHSIQRKSEAELQCKW